MAARTLAFALGALFAHQLGVLPDPLWAGLAPLLLPAVIAGGRLAAPAAFALGIAWTAAFGHHGASGRLPVALEGADLRVTGTVVQVPLRDAHRIRFALEVEAVQGLAAGVWRARGCRLRLGWYRPAPGLRLLSGQRWQATLRLRRPRGLRNPGGYDAEHRALRDGVCAWGYVRAQPPARLLAEAGPGLGWLRQHLAARIAGHLDGIPAAGVVRALAVGLRDRVTPEQTWLLQATGTAHLMAISGLHVGLVAGLGMLAGRTGARLVPGALGLLPAAHWGALAALAAAGAYAALAGFSVPTQRALFMLAAFLGAGLARRRCGRFHGLLLALAMVLVLDPLAANDVGTWLSFTAVAGLLWALWPHPPGGGPRALAAVALRTQLAACLVLAPLAVLCFAYQSLSAPLANLIAVPVTGLLAVPLVLAGTACDALSPAVGGALLRAGAHLLGVLLEMLERIPGHDRVLVPAAAPGALALAAAFPGAALLLAPLPARLRLLGLLWLAPLAMPPHAAPPPGALEVQVLDVGQGLAAVLRTRDHTLVFDAGPAWGAGRGAGAAIVAPALRRGGVGRVDVLMVSHHHADHAGGAAGLLRVMPVADLLGDAGTVAAPAIPCRDGQEWRWDGYRFRVLHPAPGTEPGNDASCVLHVSGPGGAALLPADVEAGAESALLARHGPALAADLLLVPHHGSATSSTPAFLDAVTPSVAVNSSGHRNRHRLPARTVTARYRARGIALLDTACHGAVTVRLVPGRDPVVQTWRERGLRFWHAREVAAHCR